MSQEIVLGEIKEINEDGSVVITAMLPNLNTAIARNYSKVEIGFCDGRTLSPEQRRKIYALLGEIADWVGDEKSAIKETMKWEFVVKRMDKMRKTMFSLSNVDMNTASDFISFLIDFMLEHDIPSNIPLTDLCEDIERYVYSCLLNKRCSVCGKAGELHHLEGSRVGMGSDRTEIPHIGREAICLCREHHTIVHNMSEYKFLHDNHLVGVKIDEAIAKRYKLKTKEARENEDEQSDSKGQDNKGRRIADYYKR